MTTTPQNAAELISKIDTKISQVRVRSLDLSFNELLDMSKNDELVISPEYQRLFRWSEGKQSRFLESLLIDLPVPPVFVLETADNVYELIDGLQRISSYLHFRGAHPKRLNADGSPQHLTLQECDIISELNGYGFSDLPTALQVKLKRAFIRVQVIEKANNAHLRYYMFKRLNTGGEDLSDQEIRNCTIRLLDNTFNDFIMRMSKEPDFAECIENISSEQKDELYDQELVLRFFAFKNYRDKYVHNIGDFLTEYMEAVSDPEITTVTFNYDEETETFKKAFKFLKTTLGNSAFSAVNADGRKDNGFRSLQYEAFAIGVLKNLGGLDLEKHKDKIVAALWAIKEDPAFKKMTTGGGKNYSNELNKRIEFVEERFKKL